MKKLRVFQNLALITQVGLTLSVYIIGAVFIGSFIDKKLNTAPLFLLICLIVGLAAAFFNMYRMLLKIGTKKGDEDKWKK